MLGITSHYQWTFLICMYTGYMLYIFNRRSFSFVIPTVIKKDEMEMSQVGEVLSSIAMAYSIGKFVSGMLVDRLSPRIMFSVGLFLTGVANLAFSVAEAKYLGILAFFNGLMQGPGWPACAKIVRRWYSPKVFGSIWSILSTSMNVPASIGPLACTYYLEWNGGNWRAVMLICGTISCGFAAVSLFVLKDQPEDVGLTLNKLTGEKIDEKTKPRTEDKQSTAQKPKKATWKRILSSPYAYIISLGFLMSLLIKGVVDNWSSLYLIQTKESNQHLSSRFIGMVEVGGLIGSIISGVLSDQLVAVYGFKSKGQPRHSWVIVCHLLLLASFFTLTNMINNANEQKMLLTVAGFVVGFAMYSIINLMGVMVIESSASDISGSSHAYCALMGNVGLMLAGLPFSMLQQSLMWNGAFQVCQVLIMTSLSCFIVAQFMQCRIGDLFKED